MFLYLPDVLFQRKPPLKYNACEPYRPVLLAGIFNR